jgi:hypothetical protein
MAYSEKARELRRCKATRADGQPCRAWACWDDPDGRCMAHAGRHHTGPMPFRWATSTHQAARVVPCTCRAYGWPHRPGGGLCRWPDLPTEKKF